MPQKDKLYEVLPLPKLPGLPELPEHLRDPNMLDEELIIACHKYQERHEPIPEQLLPWLVNRFQTHLIRSFSSTRMHAVGRHMAYLIATGQSRRTAAKNVASDCDISPESALREYARWKKICRENM